MDPELSDDPAFAVPGAHETVEVIDDLVAVERLEADLAEIDRALHALNAPQSQ